MSKVSDQKEVNSLSIFLRSTGLGRKNDHHERLRTSAGASCAGTSGSFWDVKFAALLYLGYWGDSGSTLGIGSASVMAFWSLGLGAAAGARDAHRSDRRVAHSDRAGHRSDAGSAKHAPDVLPAID